jgi:hypothetical protein
VIAAAFTLSLTLLACSVNVKDHGDDGADKVDISTPVGGIHVDEDADVRDTGLPVYPRARPKPKTDDGDKKSANVNLSAFGYGLKVVALEYESDDPPDKGPVEEIRQRAAMPQQRQLLRKWRKERLRRCRPAQVRRSR